MAKQDAKKAAPRGGGPHYSPERLSGREDLAAETIQVRGTSWAAGHDNETLDHLLSQMLSIRKIIRSRTDRKNPLDFNLAMISAGPQGSGPVYCPANDRLLRSETRRKRLHFRAARRGFKEADAIFGAFADIHLGELNEAELASFEALLDAPDQDVYDWLRGYAPVPTSHDTSVFARLTAICNRKNPIWNV